MLVFALTFRLYSSAKNTFGDLVRRDYEREKERKWGWLRSELQPGAAADESAFEPLNAEALIAKAKSRRKSHAG